MKPINPIFINQKEKSHPLVTVTKVRKKPITKEDGRKTRCDKKKDVKVPFSAEERELIKRISHKKGLDPTPYCTQLIKKALRGKHQFSEVAYDPKGKPYPVKLEEYFHEQLFEYTVLWDCSLREAAYRILSFMLDLEVRNRK